MSTKNNDYLYVHLLNTFHGLGPQKLYALASHFKSFEQAWHANESQLQKAGLSKRLSQNICKEKNIIDPEEEWNKLQSQDIQITTIQDKYFPKKLKTISSPPFLLYVRGDINILDQPSVAIVGSRKISDYGKHAVLSFVSDIARVDIVIVSGLALGTDALAHRETLENSGRTVAVLGGGIDDATITPRSHINLAKQILETGGAIISEYPPNTQPSRGTFPARNRIMAGLTDATIIIEATKKSGTLITATHAHKFGRKLFALPGSIFAQNSVGPNMLIRDKKASPVLCSDDILCIFKDILKDTQKNTKQMNLSNTLTKTQKILYKIIKKHPEGVQINKIIKETKLDTTTISSELTMMEIDGSVRNVGNQTYIAKS